MKLITLKTFLFCMKLETGGFVISSIHLIIQLACLIFSIVFLTVYNCSDFEQMIGTREDRICFFNRGKKVYFILTNRFFKFYAPTDFVAFMLFLAIFSVSFALLPYWCIKAIQNRNYVRIKPFMIFLAVITIISMYDLAFLTIEGLILALTKGIINGYFFFVIFSIHIMLRDEPKRRLTLQNQHPGDLKKILK